MLFSVPTCFPVSARDIGSARGREERRERDREGGEGQATVESPWNSWWGSLSGFTNMYLRTPVDVVVFLILNLL